MYHRVHDDREVGRLLLWYPGALKRMTCVLMTDDLADAPFGLSAELDRVTAVVVGYNGRLSRNVAILPDGRYVFPRCLQLTPSVAAEVLSDDEARHVRVLLRGLQSDELKRRAATNEQREMMRRAFDARTGEAKSCLLYTSPSPRDQRGSRMPSSA